MGMSLPGGWPAAVALSLALPAAAEEPLYARNFGPVAGLIGLPSQRGADTGPAGRIDLAVHGSVASHYATQYQGGEFFNFDGETARLALQLRYALADNWDLQLEAPWLEHSGGHLDSAIDSWHDFWGMSDGGRSKAPRDALYYRYQGADSFSLRDDASGPGDISLALSHRFYRHRGTSVAAVLGYKFASGDEDEFLGSGGDDAFLALRFSGEHRSELPLYWHGQLGYLRAGKSDLIANSQRRDLWFAGLGVDWRITPAWSLLAQLDAHAAPMDSPIDGLGEGAIMLTAGARWRVTGDWVLDFSVVEDVQVETAPDVTFQASLRYRAR